MKIVNKFELKVPMIFKICILANCSFKAYTNKFHEKPVIKDLMYSVKAIKIEKLNTKKKLNLKKRLKI